MATSGDEAGPSAAAQQEVPAEAVDLSVHPSGIVPKLQVRALGAVALLLPPTDWMIL